MKIIGIEHIGIALKSKKDKYFWDILLGGIDKTIDIVKDQGVKTEIYDTKKGKVEFLDALDKNSVIAKFLEKRGPGIHHISFEVANIEDAIDEMHHKGIDTVTEGFTIGAEGFKVVFVHPRYTGGILVELTQKQV